MRKHIILLHGALGCASQLNPLADLLSTTFEVHTMNFSGHGGNAFPEKYAIQLFANELLHYRNNIKSDEVYVFGYSMGGYVALFAALQQPDAFCKIITLATKYDWTPESALREVSMLNAEVIEQKVPKYAAQLAQRFAPHDWKEALRLTAALMLDLGTNPLVTPQTVSKLSTPVCVGIGDKDTMVSMNETLSIYNAMPTGNFFVLPETPHPIERVNYVVLATLINAYIHKETANGTMK